MQAHLAAADVEDVGDRPVGGVVVGDVRVEQQQRHAAHLGEPDGAPDRAPGHLDADRQRIAVSAGNPPQRQPLGVVVGIGVLLVAVGVDRLAEVAVAVEEAHADERDGHVRGGLEVVAGEHAQAAGVDAERLVEAVLGAEVGDRAVEVGAVLCARTSGPSRSPCSGRTRRSASGTRPSGRRPRGSATSRGGRAAAARGCGSAASDCTSMRRNSTRTRGCHIQ